MKLPLIGLGTWELTGRECTRVVKQALELGYRHIDTAHVYKNHKAIQKAIADFDRKSLFLTSKLILEQVSSKHIESSVEKTCERALKELGTDYLDLYLIHSPDRAMPMAKIFQAMGKLIQEKKILRVGVSNFTLHHLQDLLQDGCKPFANQVEFHPYLYQKELWEFCKAHGIQLISYRSLGKKKLLHEPLFIEIGHRYGKSSAQILLRWLVQQDIPVIPKASSEKHLRENLEVFDFSLSSSEMKQMADLNKNKRFCRAEDSEFSY